MSKKSVFSWQIIEFLNDLLEFFENLLEFFFGLSFFGLEFFSKCPKKKPVLSRIPQSPQTGFFGHFEKTNKKTKAKKTQANF